MKASLALLCCLTAVVSGFVVELNDDEFQWNAWKTYHDKIYATASEENVRRAIWRDNLKKIAQHNSQGHSHVLGMNHLGDLTQDEFRFHYLGMRGHLGSRNTTGSTTYLPASHVTLPIEVDWRKEGYVTEVKNQGQCGSCWAFSATGSLEGQHFRKTGKLVSLSEQNLVDCSMKFGNHGCRGGLMDYAFKFIKANGGVDTEASYPYKARDEACWFANRDVGATVTGFVDIPEGSEESLQLATATIGPISVAIDAGHFSFQFYRSGVYNERRCSSTRLNHGVLAVGYGTFQGKDYWLVKNSWGVEWGMDGYMMMSRNKNNQCGIATCASYPLV